MNCKACNHLEADHYKTRSEKVGCARCIDSLFPCSGFELKEVV